MANTTYSGWSRGQYYSGPYGQPVVDSIIVTGVSAVATVSSVQMWNAVEGPPSVTWNTISDAQTPSWAEISTSQTPDWSGNIAA
tara:strand:+ start:1472 stop:1723 length:252 start_codon:yes stop_codon:yes gene_type:complete